MEQIGNIHVVQNQYSLEHAGKKRQRVHRQRYTELRESQYGSRVSSESRIIATSKHPEETIEKIAKRYSPGDVIALLMGDGGLHDFTNGIARYATDPALKAARLLVLDGGFANDGARQLHSKHALKRPSTILDRNLTIDFAPLRWEFGPDQGIDVRLANLYGSLGASARVAQAISEEGNRQWAGDNWFKKAWITRTTAREIPCMPITLSAKGPCHEMYDIGFANGSHMSGFGGAFPVSLEEDRSYQYETVNPRYILAGMRLALGNTPGTFRSAPCTLGLPRGGAVQLDGEAWLLPEDTSVTVSQHDEKFTVFASR
ncbi:MAG: hypothetical protein JWP13_208 [Candidatus Saccharibacteria bacterium]|nr:hypothetical protein [Candidatus Saccharibacteria bacterium]